MPRQHPLQLRHPGIIATPIWGKIPTGATGNLRNAPIDPRNAPPRCAAARVGEAQDIANGVLFLCTEAANYMTGQELVIDGGITAGGRPRPRQQSCQWAPREGLDHRRGSERRDLRYCRRLCRTRPRPLDRGRPQGAGMAADGQPLRDDPCARDDGRGRPWRSATVNGPAALVAQWLFLAGSVLFPGALLCARLRRPAMDRRGGPAHRRRHLHPWLVGPWSCCGDEG